MKSTKWSNFHVTVNFNKDDESHMPQFRHAIDQMVESPYLWWWLKRWDGASEVNFTTEDASDVESVRIRAAFEHEGEKNKGLHAHLVIEVAHCTMVRISKYGICEIMRHFVRMNPNCFIRFLEGSGEDKDFILQYITKEVPTYRPQSQLNSRLKSAFAEGRHEVVEAENLSPDA